MVTTKEVLHKCYLIFQILVLMFLGAIDVLVREERILLVLSIYAPNLWRVFLSYAQDAVGKVPDINDPFPENAQFNEMGIFKLPHAAPSRHRDNVGGHNSPVNSIFITESGCARFAGDYGLTPHLMSSSQLRSLYKNINIRMAKNKTILSNRLPIPPSANLAQKKKKVN
jgi:hypothetical protein